MTPSRTLSGPQSMRGAVAASAPIDDSIPWWIAPPPQARRVHEIGSIVVPTVLAGETLIVSFQVPSGLQFAWTDIVIDYDGGGWVQGKPQCTFQVDIDNPVGGVPQGYPLQGIDSKSLLLGSFQVAPWPLRKAEILEAEQIARIKVTNLTLGNVGDPNYFNAAIIGWCRPRPLRMQR